LKLQCQKAQEAKDAEQREQAQRRAVCDEARQMARQQRESELAERRAQRAATDEARRIGRQQRESELAERRVQRAQQKERELGERRALVQARLRPGLLCNINSIVLLNEVHQYYDVGSCNMPCMHCGALGFQDENRDTDTQRHYGLLCYRKDKIMFERIPELPPTLHHLVNSQNNEAKHFCKNICLFNAGMAMASFQANDKTVNRGAPGAFKIVGTVFRRIGDALPNDNQDPKCLQLYFLDPDYQASFRATRYQSESQIANPIDKEIFLRLHSGITEEANNSYVRSFLTVVE